MIDNFGVIAMLLVTLINSFALGLAVGAGLTQHKIKRISPPSDR